MPKRIHSEDTGNTGRKMPKTEHSVDHDEKFKEAINMIRTAVGEIENAADGREGEEHINTYIEQLEQALNIVKHKVSSMEVDGGGKKRRTKKRRSKKRRKSKRRS